MASKSDKDKKVTGRNQADSNRASAKKPSPKPTKKEE
jgi:hypothetical protein